MIIKKSIVSTVNIQSGNRLFIILLSSIPFILHLYTNAFAGYGIFRDELYYLACASNPDFGYVDQPPLSIYALMLSKAIFGDSIFAIRLLPAAASFFIVFFTCLITSGLGGGRFALALSAICVILAPVYLGMCSIYSMNCFDILLCVIAYYLMLKIVKSGRPADWMMFGIILGLGLMNKVGFLWICFGFFAALILTDKRKWFLTPYPYVAALIAVLISTPYIIWNFQNDFAHIEFIRNATSGKYSGLSKADFVIGQFINVNPFSSFVWIAGLLYLLFDKDGRQFRLLAIVFIISFLVLFLNSHVKAEYLASQYAVLFSAGAVGIEKFTNKKARSLRYASVGLIIVTGVFLSPLALPVLPVETFIKYSQALGIEPGTSEDNELGDLPQFYADMFGWEDLAKNVSEVYASLSEEEKKRAIVFGQNYGEAGAIDYYRKKFPLPGAISSHNAYWTWRYPEIDDPVLIIIGGDIEDHMEYFETVEIARIHTTRYSMPYENDLPLFIARKMKVDLGDAWEKIKHYN